MTLIGIRLNVNIFGHSSTVCSMFQHMEETDGVNKRIKINNSSSIISSGWNAIATTTTEPWGWIPFFFIDNVGVNEFIGRCHWDYFLVPHGIFLWLHKKPHFAPYHHHTAHLHNSSYSVFYFFFFLAYFLPKFTITKTRMFVTEFD